MKNIKTLSFYKANEEEIKVGEIYYFGQLWDGEGNGHEILESGSICIEDTVIDFKVIEKESDILDTQVIVTELN